MAKKETTTKKTTKKGKKENATLEQAAPPVATTKKIRRSSLFTPINADADSFFTVNKRKKPAFVPGWDAKLTGILKRVKDGIGDDYDHTIANHPTILAHPKVVNSKHFQYLLGNVEGEEEEYEEDAA